MSITELKVGEIRYIRRDTIMSSIRASSQIREKYARPLEFSTGICMLGPRLGSGSGRGKKRLLGGHRVKVYHQSHMTTTRHYTMIFIFRIVGKKSDPRPRRYEYVPLPPEGVGLGNISLECLSFSCSQLSSSLSF